MADGSINQRIKELIAHLNFTPANFASSIGVNKGTFHNVVSGRLSRPSSEMLSAIQLAYPEISVRWLLAGEGEMLQRSYLKKVAAYQQEQRNQQQSQIKPVSQPITVNESSTANSVLPDHDDAIPFVPIAAEGSYLQGFADEEYIEHMPKFYLPFLGLGQGVYAFQVRGDSMSDRFNNGDVVFGQKVEPNDALRWGEVYVLLCNDGLVVKELRKGADDAHFTLRSYNEHFDPYDILKTEVRQLYRYQASISFNSSNPNRGGVISFLRGLSEQMSQVQNTLSNLPQVK